MGGRGGQPHPSTCSVSPWGSFTVFKGYPTLATPSLQDALQGLAPKAFLDLAPADFVRFSFPWAPNSDPILSPSGSSAKGDFAAQGTDNKVQRHVGCQLEKGCIYPLLASRG